MPQDRNTAVVIPAVVPDTLRVPYQAIPNGHTHGQQVLARLHEEITRLGGELAERSLETAGSYAPAYEALCHAQSHLYTRLFRS